MFKFITISLLVMSMLNAQSNENVRQKQVQVGDIYQIGKPETSTYQYINFPRPNLIAKKGGIANYKEIEGRVIVVTMVEEKKHGTTQISIKRQDGGRFFGSHTYVSASFKEAITSGELQAK